MRSWARWAVISIILALSASVAPPARASFGDCSSKAYWALFDERYGDPSFVREFDCVERVRIPVATRGSTRHIRIIHDRSADWIADAAAMAEFERGARAAAAAIGRLGGVDLEDVTLFLTDDFPPREGAHTFSNVAASAEFTRDGECHVIVYLIGPAGTRRHSATAVAHEIFHCIQVANLSSAQMRSGSGGLRGGGDWWLEGSATWFAALALPDPGPLPDEVDRFDSSSATTPLNAMAYEASPFFLWLGQNASPAGVMGFLREMASDRSESAQRAAMAAALPQEDWLLFAQDYLDGAIRHPHGTDLSFAEPAQGDAWTWSATQTRTAPLEPFVLHRGVIAFECGRWRTSVDPAPTHGARPQDGGAWNALPAAIDTTSGSGGNYRLAAINATPSRVTLSVVGTMESGCGDCAGVRTTDACLVGSWRMTGGGGPEWLRRQGVEGNYRTSNETIVFRRDGTYVTGMVGLESDGRLREGGSFQGRGQVQAGGRWSTSAGVLNLCADMQHLSGQTVITTRDGQRVTIPVPSAPPEPAHPRYSCAGSTLDLEIPIPGAAPMPSQYTRTGGE